MRWWVCGLCTLLGCGSVVDVPADSGSGTSSGSANPDPGTSAPPVDPSGVTAGVTTAAGVTSAADTSSSTAADSGASTSASSSSSESSAGDAPPVSVCDPQPEGSGVLFFVNDGPLYEFEQLDIVETCEVFDIEGNDDVWDLSFACESGDYTLNLSTPATPGLQLGDTVELSLFIYAPWWGNGFVKVMRDGELQVAAMASQALPIGGGSFPPEDFFAPLSLGVIADVCDPEPLEDPGDGGNFIGDAECTQDRRLALEFELDGASTTLLDRTAGDLGPLQLYVGDTVSHVKTFCTDTPDGWREFVAVRP